MRKKVIAIYPGSFDPPTNGHLDLIERGAKIFDVLIVAVLRNSAKTTPLFSVEERLSMLRKTTKKWDNVRIDAFAGLLVDYAVRCKAQVVLRGIRAVSDYEYELQMALMNRKLNKGLETMFMMPAGAYSYLSSGLVREISALGGSVCNLIPKVVERELKRKLAASSRKSKTKQE